MLSSPQSQPPSSPPSHTLSVRLGSHFNHVTPQRTSLVTIHNSTNTTAVPPNAATRGTHTFLGPRTAFTPTILSFSTPLLGAAPIRPVGLEDTPAPVLPITLSVGEGIATLRLPSVDASPFAPPTGAPFGLPISLPAESGVLDSSLDELPDPPPRLSLSPGLSPLPPFQEGVPMLSALVLPQVHSPSAAAAAAAEDEGGATMTTGIVAFAPGATDDVAYDVVSADGKTCTDGASGAEEDAFTLMSCRPISPRLLWSNSRDGSGREGSERG